MEKEKEKKDHHSRVPVSLEKHYLCSMLALVAKVSAVLDLFIYKVYTWDHYLYSKLRQRDSVVLLIEKSFPMSPKDLDYNSQNIESRLTI